MAKKKNIIRDEKNKQINNKCFFFVFIKFCLILTLSTSIHILILFNFFLGDGMINSQNYDEKRNKKLQKLKNTKYPKNLGRMHIYRTPCLNVYICIQEFPLLENMDGYMT